MFLALPCNSSAKNVMAGEMQSSEANDSAMTEEMHFGLLTILLFNLIKLIM